MGSGLGMWEVLLAFAAVGGFLALGVTAVVLAVKRIGGSGRGAGNRELEARISELERRLGVRHERKRLPRR